VRAERGILNQRRAKRWRWRTAIDTVVLDKTGTLTGTANSGDRASRPLTDGSEANCCGWRHRPTLTPSILCEASWRPRRNVASVWKKPGASRRRPARCSPTVDRGPASSWLGGPASASSGMAHRREPSKSADVNKPEAAEAVAGCATWVSMFGCITGDRRAAAEAAAREAGIEHVPVRSAASGTRWPRFGSCKPPENAWRWWATGS